MQKVYFISGTMCTVDLWQFVFSDLVNIIPVHIDITSAISFDDVNEIILSKIEEKAIIVGFSLGGFSALNFAIHYPERIKKIIIIAANVNGLSEKENKLRESTIGFLEVNKYKGISQVRIKQFLHPDHQNKINISIIKKMDADLGKYVLIRQLKATSARLDITQQVLVLNIPVIFIAAENDTLVSATIVKEFASKMLEGKYFSIKNCGHMIPLEKPKELVRLLNLVLF